MDTTAHDLKLLSVGYFIQGGIATFYGLVFAAYLAIMGAVFGSVLTNVQSRSQVPIPAGVLSLIGVILGCVLLLVILMGLLMLYCGLALRRRRHRLLVLIMAGVNLLSIPYGTVLGIFTILVLQRPAAKAMFDQPLIPPPQQISPQSA